MEGGPPGFRQDFSCPAVLRKCGHPGATVSRTGLSPAVAGLPRTVPLQLRFLTGRASPAAPLQPRAPEGTRFGLLPVRSPLLGESRLISTPAGTQMVHSPAYTACALCIGAHANVIRTFGLPHSEIRGSSGIGPFPRLIAANHVLHRLAAPRHPPWTLIHLTISFFQSLR